MKFIFGIHFTILIENVFYTTEFESNIGFLVCGTRNALISIAL